MAPVVAITLLKSQSDMILVLLYIGPDALMPVLSALAAFAGVLLMFWRRLVGFAGSTLRRLSGQSAKSSPNEAGRPPT